LSWWVTCQFRIPCIVLILTLVAACQSVGSCLPLFTLLMITLLLLHTTVNSINLASRNALLDVISGLYRDAQREVRMLALSLPPDAAVDLLPHDRALEAFLEASRYRAKLMGFPVSYGTIRTLLATMLTLAVAAWSVLRGLGVRITVESFCPL
jgi:hypothetical protein